MTCYVGQPGNQAGQDEQTRYWTLDFDCDVRHIRRLGNQAGKPYPSPCIMADDFDSAQGKQLQPRERLR